MSARYEFIEPFAELLDGPCGMLGVSPEEGKADHEAGDVYLVLGNPYGTAAVLQGTRDEIAATLRSWLGMLEV